jgi:long-chain acyl-CoA synthetase
MTHPGEKFYPEGVHWDDPIARGTLPDLLSKAAGQYAARPAIEFRDRPISYTELEAGVEVAASAFLRAGYSKDASVALFLGNSPDHPVNFFGALKAGARVVHLSPLDGERALSHKLSDSGARILVTSDLAALLPMALRFLEKGLLDRLIVCEDDHWAQPATRTRRSRTIQRSSRSGNSQTAPQNPCSGQRSRSTTSRCCNIPAAPPACRKARCSAMAI